MASKSKAKAVRKAQGFTAQKTVIVIAIASVLVLAGILYFTWHDDGAAPAPTPTGTPVTTNSSQQQAPSTSQKTPGEKSTSSSNNGVKPAHQ